MRKNQAIALALLGYTLMVFGVMLYGITYSNPFIPAFGIAIAFLISYTMFIKISK